jgi:hypothetical protein
MTCARRDSAIPGDRTRIPAIGQGGRAALIVVDEDVVGDGEVSGSQPERRRVDRFFFGRGSEPALAMRLPRVAAASATVSPAEPSVCRPAPVALRAITRTTAAAICAP